MPPSGDEAVVENVPVCVDAALTLEGWLLIAGAWASEIRVVTIDDLADSSESEYCALPTAVNETL